MVETVKAGVYVSLNEPVCAGKCFLDLIQGCLTASVGPESMRFIAENRLINAFQNHLNDFLHKLVVAGLNTQRTLFTAVFLSNICSSCRLRTVTAVS